MPPALTPAHLQEDADRQQPTTGTPSGQDLHAEPMAGAAECPICTLQRPTRLHPVPEGGAAPCAGAICNTCADRISLTSVVQSDRQIAGLIEDRAWSQGDTSRILYINQLIQRERQARGNSSYCCPFCRRWTQHPWPRTQAPPAASPPLAAPALSEGRSVFSLVHCAVLSSCAVPAETTFDNRRRLTERLSRLFPEASRRRFVNLVNRIFEQVNPTTNVLAHLALRHWAYSARRDTNTVGLFHSPEADQGEIEARLSSFLEENLGAQLRRSVDAFASSQLGNSAATRTANHDRRH